MKALARILLVVGITYVLFPSTPAHINNSTGSAEAQTVQAMVNESIPQPQEPSPQPPTPVEPEKKPLTDKQKLMQAAGIPQSEWEATDYIVSKESSWRHTAVNPDSGAYGLCQAYPKGKMASAGTDYMTNPITQLRWCHQYAQHRYGGWWNSFAFWKSNRWW